MLDLSVLPSSINRRWSMTDIVDALVTKLIEMASQMDEERRIEFIRSAKELLLLPEGSFSALE